MLSIPSAKSQLRTMMLSFQAKTSGMFCLMVFSNYEPSCEAQSSNRSIDSGFSGATLVVAVKELLGSFGPHCQCVNTYLPHRLLILKFFEFI